MYLSCIQVTFCQMGYHFITYVPSIYVFKESQYVPVYIQTTLREKARWALCVECIHHKVICDMYLLSYTDYIMRSSQKGCIYTCRVMKYHVILRYVPVFSHTDYIMQTVKSAIYMCRLYMLYNIYMLRNPAICTCSSTYRLHNANC